jgi:sugar phosphate isomerase/epimerase
VSLASELCLCARSLPTRPFAELVAAAAKAGFGSMTLWPNIWRHGHGSTESGTPAVH